MYIERFWIKDILGDTFFNLLFCNEEQKIYRWSIFQNADNRHTDRENTLFFKFLAVCVGGSRYLLHLKNEISRVYRRRNEITGFGAILRSDTYRQTHQAMKALENLFPNIQFLLDAEQKAASIRS